MRSKQLLRLTINGETREVAQIGAVPVLVELVAEPLAHAEPPNRVAGQRRDAFAGCHLSVPSSATTERAASLPTNGSFPSR